MEFLTKEKSSKKENRVNNQNNSVELFPVTNTWVTSSYLNYFSIKKTQLVVLKKGSSLMLLEDKSKDFESNLKPLSIDSFNQMVNKSIEDTKKGKVVNGRDLKESVKKWK